MPFLLRMLPALLFAFATPAVAEYDLVTIGAIDGETVGALSVVNIRLDKKPSWAKVKEIQDHGSFLQIVLPGTIVPEPGKFYDGGNPHLTKVGVFQLTPSDAGIRLFVSKSAKQIREAMAVEILGSRIVLTVDPAKFPQPLPRELAGPPAPDRLPELTAEDVIARTEVRRGEPLPSDTLKASPLATGGLDLREKLVSVAIFSGIMILLLLFSFAVRPWLRRRTATKTGDEPAFTMKTLASMPLAARQKVSLIQVGDERILLGVTQDSVTFLTTVGKSQQVSFAPQPAFAQFQPQAAQQFLAQRSQQQPQQQPKQAAPAPKSALARALKARAPAFASALADDGPTVDLRQPVLKNIEGNDEASLRDEQGDQDEQREEQRPAPRAEPRAEPKPMKRAGSRINLSIGDDGVKDLVSRPAPRAPVGEAPGSQKAIDDVTRLIREKLKTLRTI